MNENKFSGIADLYAKHRPTYSQAFVDYLYSGLLSDKSVVADIGSGTGLFAELLLMRGSKVFAVEPNADMRKAAENNLSKYRNFVSVSGEAERTTLDNASCDFITVAQAFHWFDRLAFKNECKRILKPSGRVAIIYNNRDSSHPLVAENLELNKRYCPQFKGFSGGMAEANPQEFSSFFSGGVCDYKAFKNDLVYDKQGFIGRSLSASYALREGEKNYCKYISELEGLFEKYSLNGELSLPNLTTSYIGRV